MDVREVLSNTCETPSNSLSASQVCALAVSRRAEAAPRLNRVVIATNSFIASVG